MRFVEKLDNFPLEEVRAVMAEKVIELLRSDASSFDEPEVLFDAQLDDLGKQLGILPNAHELGLVGFGNRCQIEPGVPNAG